MRTLRRLGGGVAVLTATVVVLAAAQVVEAQDVAAPICFGEAATIVGSRGADKVVGTVGRDVIFSPWRGQAIHGLGGDDRLCGYGNIYGGWGNDRLSIRRREILFQYSIFGGPGHDILRRDESLADPHFPLLTVGGPGRDRLYGGPNWDDLRGGPGRDRVFGAGFSDELTGGRGPDLLVGAQRRDIVRGGPGDDVAYGGPGRDLIWGGPGTDEAVGGSGVDDCREVEERHCELG